MIVDVERGAELLRAAELVAYPTETVYGLGADAASPRALARLRDCKGRVADKGLSVLVEDASALPSRARGLAARFWPGAVTLVVETADPGLRAVATPDGVGFRCSSHPTAAALARAFGGPIVATSCNRSGEPPCRTAGEVESVFGAELAVVGGEPAGGGPPSTVVALRPDGQLELLREGAVPFTEILEESRA